MYPKGQPSPGLLVLASSAAHTTGFTFDRQWMVVAEDTGKFVTQRQEPRLALVSMAQGLASPQARAPRRMPCAPGFQHACEPNGRVQCINPCRRMRAGPRADPAHTANGCAGGSSPKPPGRPGACSARRQEPPAHPSGTKRAAAAAVRARARNWCQAWHLCIADGMQQLVPVDGTNHANITRLLACKQAAAA